MASHDLALLRSMQPTHVLQMNETDWTLRPW